MFLCLFRMTACTLFIFSGSAIATGMLPETSVVIIEQGDGEGAINVKNTDAFPVLLLTTLQDIPEDRENILIITPPAARVESGKTQRVRFILTNKTPLKTERMKRVIFEGIPPQKKGESEVRMTVRQNLPVLIRPTDLPRDVSPWKNLVWRMQTGNITVSNPSPYVVRLGQSVQTLPDNSLWLLPHPYILPGQILNLKLISKRSPSVSSHQVRISPASAWGYTVNTYDTSLTQ